MISCYKWSRLKRYFLSPRLVFLALINVKMLLLLESLILKSKIILNFIDHPGGKRSILLYAGKDASEEVSVKIVFFSSCFKKD